MTKQLAAALAALGIAAQAAPAFAQSADGGNIAVAQQINGQSNNNQNPEPAGVLPDDKAGTLFGFEGAEVAVPVVLGLGAAAGIALAVSGGGGGGGGNATPGTTE